MVTLPPTPKLRLVLASASPARLALLEQARFAPEVVVSGVDESVVTADGPEQLVQALATAKAVAVHEKLAAVSGALDGWLVIGCDSMFEFGGVVRGKPASNDEARDRLLAVRGHEGRLHTGHCLIHGDGRRAEGVGTTLVRFGQYSNTELDAYLATGEALAVAGAFTLEGRSAPFVDGVDGDPSNVVGLSLPLFRRLLGDFGISVVDLWT